MTFHRIYANLKNSDQYTKVGKVQRYWSTSAECPKYISSAPNLAKIRACAHLVMREEFNIISM